MYKSHRSTSSETGVSEAIGFLLIFSLMIVGIGLVTLYGYPMLLQQQTSADEQIMEKNMIVLQNDVKSLAYKTVPYKETSLKIGGGSLAVYNSSSAFSTIDIYDSAAHPKGTGYINSSNMSELTYSSISASTDIALQNGAVVKRDRIAKGSVMLAEPRWYYDGMANTMVINLVNVTSTGIISRTGVGTVQMGLGDTEFILADTSAVAPDIPLGDHVYLDYSPDAEQDYSVAWDNYFQKRIGMTLISGTPGTGSLLTYEFPATSRLVIKKFNINIISV